MSAPGDAQVAPAAGSSEPARPAPAISVCITTRGRPDLLEVCMRGLKAQSDPPPFELLVCCQGAAEVAEVVYRHFPSAVVGFVEHAYPGGARNFLVRRARGELLLFLDDDVDVPSGLLAHLHA